MTGFTSQAGRPEAREFLQEMADAWNALLDKHRVSAREAVATLGILAGDLILHVPDPEEKATLRRTVIMNVDTTAGALG